MKTENNTFLKFTALIHKPSRKAERKKENLNDISSADQPTDSRPPEATSAPSTHIDRTLISPPAGMKRVHTSCFPEPFSTRLTPHKDTSAFIACASRNCKAPAEVDLEAGSPVICCLHTSVF